MEIVSVIHTHGIACQYQKTVTGYSYYHLECFKFPNKRTEMQVRKSSSLGGYVAYEELEGPLGIVKKRVRIYDDDMCNAICPTCSRYGELMWDKACFE